MTLYTSRTTRAGSGESACNGGCATHWPRPRSTATERAAKLTGATGELATITRDDGAMQVDVQGHAALPLRQRHGGRRHEGRWRRRHLVRREAVAARQ